MTPAEEHPARFNQHRCDAWVASAARCLSRLDDAVPVDEFTVGYHMGRAESQERRLFAVGLDVL
jgi:hypothetical protein